MAVIVPPHYESRKMANLLTDYEKRLKRIEDGLRTGQLGNASLENASIKLNDADGNTRGVIGPDAAGFWGFLDTNNPNPPPVPTPPTLTAAFNSLIVEHDGTTADGAGFPSDLSTFKIWLAPPSGEYALVGTMNVGGNKGFPAKFAIGPLENQEYSVKVSAINFSKKESDRSDAATATPTLVVGQDILAGIIDATKLAAESVTEASLAAQAVTKTKVADNAIDTPQLVAGAVKADKIAAAQIEASHIITGAITSEKIATLAITTDKLAANSVEAGKIAAGAVTANKLDANLVVAGRIIAGDPTAARVELNPTAGIQAFKDDSETRTFWLDAATGSAFFMGELTTAISGSTRIVINPGGTVPDEMRFYQTGSTYAYLNAEPATGGTAALRGRSQVSSNRLGSFGCYPAEAFINHTYSPSGVVSAACSVLSNTVNIWSYTINLSRVRSSTAVPSDGGVPRTAIFEISNPLNAAIANTVMEFKTKTVTGDEPMFVAPARDSGMVFAVSRIYMTHGDGSGTIAISAAAFTQESGRAAKVDIRDLDFDSTPYLKKGVKKWKRPRDVPPKADDWYLPTPATKPGDPSPAPVKVPGRQRPAAPDHIGPIAEDLPEICLVRDPEKPNDPPHVEIFAYAALIHDGLVKLIERVEALERTVNGTP